MAAPPTIPVITFMSPAYGDLMLTEAHNTELGSYVELPIGTPHPNVKHYPGYVLVKQAPFQGDEKWIMRFWTADPELENTYNLQSRSYDADDNTKEVLVRTYAYRRKDYEPLTKLSKITGVIAVRVTGAGTLYDSTATVAFSGGAGSGATGVPIVFRGAIVGVRMTAEGTGYTSAPTVTFSASAGGGTLATGTAVIQNSSAVLVREEAGRMDGDPMDGVYLKVVRTYMVLPGAYIPFTRYDQMLGPIQGRRRAVANTGQTASLTATVKTTYEGRDGSSVVLWEIEETNSDGSGSGSNPAFPILEEDIYDAQRGAVSIRSQIVVATGSEVGSFTITGGNLAVWTRYEAVSQFLVRAITERWSVPGPTRTESKTDRESGALITITRVLMATSGITASNSVTSDILTLVEAEPSRYHADLSERVTTTIAKAAYYDDTHYHEEEKWMPYTFPGILAQQYIAQGDGAVGYIRPKSLVVKHLIRTWWINSVSKPSITVDEIITDTVFFNDVLFPNVLHDETAALAFPSGATFQYLATTPTATVYLGTWVPGGPRVIEGSVEPDGYINRWKVVIVLVQMQGKLPTYTAP